MQECTNWKVCATAQCGECLDLTGQKCAYILGFYYKLIKQSDGKAMRWQLRLFNLIPNFVKKIGCVSLRKLGRDPDAWLEGFLKKHKGE